LFSLNAAAVADFVVFAVQFLISWNEKLNSTTHCLARNDPNRWDEDVVAFKAFVKLETPY